MANNNSIVTVKELRLLCHQQIRKGNGQKRILISSDDEGNSFHTLFCGFINDQKLITECQKNGMFHDDIIPSKVILLGLLIHGIEYDVDGLTVDKLYELCRQEEKSGNGDKEIMISSDDEGNNLHSLFFHFTTKPEALKVYADTGMFHDNNDPNEIVILG